MNIRLKHWILAMALVLGIGTTAHATTINLSGHLDLSQAGTGKVTVTAGGLVGTVQANGDWTVAGVTDAVVPKDGLILDQPRLSWTNLGKTVQLHGVGNPENYTVDAYGLDGRVLGQHLNFNGNGIAVIPGNGSAGPVALKLHGNGTRNLVAGSARAMTDSSADSGVVYIIVTDPNGNTDTLREIPVTSWTSVLGTQYVVQRNVDVTIPTAYDNDTVKVGWFNVYTNPSNYYSTVLGRFHAKQYSGFVYTAYDSASFAGNSYLYSALAVVKNSHDSVVAFTTDLDTVTAKVGNFSFDSTRFGTGILSVSADSLTIPWYAFNVTNGTSVTAYKSAVKTLDSNTFYTISLDSTWLDTNFYKIITTTSIQQSVKLSDSTKLKISFTSADGDTTYELDSVFVTFESTGGIDTAGLMVPTYVSSSVGIASWWLPVGDTLNNVSGTNIVKFHSNSWMPMQANAPYVFKITGAGGLQFVSMQFVYRKHFYK